MLKIMIRIIITFGMLGLIIQGGLTRDDYLLYIFIGLLTINVLVPDKFLFYNSKNLLSDNWIAQIFIFLTGIIAMLFVFAYIIGKYLIK